VRERNKKMIGDEKMVDGDETNNDHKMVEEDEMKNTNSKL